jgi:hypothetical protein
MAKKKQILFPFAPAPLLIKEVDIFRNLDTIAELDRRRTRDGKGKSNAVGAQGTGLRVLQL